MTIWSTEWQTSKPKDQGTDTPTDIPIHRISMPQFEMNSKTKRVAQCPFKRLTSNKSQCYFIGNLDVNLNQIPASTQYGCDRKTTSFCFNLLLEEPSYGLFTKNPFLFGSFCHFQLKVALQSLWPFNWAIILGYKKV